MEERTGPDGRIVLAGTRNCVEAPGFAPDAIVYKELTLIGALGVDTPAYPRPLTRWGATCTRSGPSAGSWHPSPVPPTCWRSWSGERSEPPPVHAVLVP